MLQPARHDSELRYDNPFLPLMEHGKALVSDGAEPLDLVAFAEQHGDVCPFSSTQSVAVKGLAAEIYRNYTTQNLFIPGMEFVE